MDWKQLICSERLGCEGTDYHDNRNSYYRDFDRIVFSKEFRLLQSKTQVVPFPEKDATHTRLTHSIETASVGRSLGTIAAERLNLKENGITPEDVGAIVAAACLCHDIGNPPLGHSGEDAISQFFLDEKGQRLLDRYVTQDYRYDFEHFEGNAMGFHILTHSNKEKTTVEGGLGLTYSTLAAFSKYPNRFTEQKEGEKYPAYCKKAGLLRCDIEQYQRIATRLGIDGVSGKNYTWVRHPLAYLTEAADDICYAVVDLEDGYRNGSVTFEEARDHLLAIIEADGDTHFDDSRIIDNSEKIGYYRAKAINALINLCVKIFTNNIQLILEGSFESTLIKSLPENARAAYKSLIDISVNKVYSHPDILLTEAAGFVVLPGLLDILTRAAFEEGMRSEKVRKTLLKGRICNDTNLTFEQRNYYTILNIVKYIAFMTDSYAVKLYRELTGIQLPNY